MTKSDIALTVHQTSRPTGFPTPAHFRFVESPVPEPAPGTALVENLYWSVDPYHREMMDGDFELNAPLEGRALGRIVASRDPSLPEGEIVFHREGWRTHSVLRPEEVRRPPPPRRGAPVRLPERARRHRSDGVRRPHPDRSTPRGRRRVRVRGGGRSRHGDRTLREAAGGGLIGSAGSAEKVKYLTGHVGYDAAFDYRTAPVAELLAEAAPDGIDLFVDNVGGDQLAAAVGALRERGRVVRIGTVGQYNTPDAPPVLFNHADVVEKSLRIEGFLVRDHRDAQEDLYEFAVPRLRAGTLALDETVVDGFELIVEAFLSMLRGGNTGKILVRAAA